jgi:hypothetical protein
MFFADDIPLLVCFTLATIKANGDCHQNRVRVGAGDAVGTRRGNSACSFFDEATSTGARLCARKVDVGTIDPPE